MIEKRIEMMVETRSQYFVNFFVFNKMFIIYLIISMSPTEYLSYHDTNK